MFFLTSGDARGLGLLFMVCACALGLRGNRLTGMRGTWGVVWRSAHVPTIPFTWLPRANALGPTAHASNHYVNNVDLTLVCVCSLSHGFTWFFMPKYGHCDVNLVTWPKCSIMIGRENFSCALIGRDLKGPLSLLTLNQTQNTNKQVSYHINRTMGDCYTLNQNHPEQNLH